MNRVPGKATAVHVLNITVETTKSLDAFSRKKQKKDTTGLSAFL